MWDPTGLIAPVTLKYKIDLQELWSAGYGWDNILPETTQLKWMENEAATNQLLTFKFDQNLKPTEATSLPQVNGFADRGELGYGATIFLLRKLHDVSHQCVPVTVKPFVAPLKQKTIPREWATTECQLTVHQKREAKSAWYHKGNNTNKKS